jgi:putative ABC transport system substrate-binding protein
MRWHRTLVAIVASLMLFALQARGQQPVHRIGVLWNIENPEAEQAWLGGLRERGYVVGRNLQIEYRYSRAQPEQIPALVAELVAFGPEVIVASGPQNTIAVHVAAPTIPLVFINVADPVGLGLAESLAHPGGNVTGFATLVPEGFVGKSLQFLKEFVPQASRIAVLINPTNQQHQRRQATLPEIGRHLGVELVVVEASKPDQLETAFEAAHTRRVLVRSTSWAIRSFSFTRRRSRGSPLGIDYRRCTWVDKSCWTGDLCPMVQIKSTSCVALAPT